MIPILEYPGPGAEGFIQRLRRRGDLDDPETLDRVRQIIARVRAEGDAAVLDYTRRFDCPDAPLDALPVPPQAIERAHADADPALLNAVRLAIDKVRAFHERMKRSSWFVTADDGVLLGQLVSPLERVGLYVPAVAAPLMSTLVMAAVPARVAGVTEIVATIPPQADGRVHPAMLMTARECEVDEVYVCGGAQAVAAMAYGTESIRSVDKIVGPGNPYSQLAKKEVFGVVDVDKIAGPSEILVIADDSANPAYVAADLISQAEHSEDCSAILLTTSRCLAEAVCEELSRQSDGLPRGDVIRASLTDYGGCLLVPDVDAAVTLANDISPEHAEVHLRDAMPVALRLRNAGGIFVGEHTPEAVGDYVAGPNHILPTGGTARFASAMGINDFTKASNVLGYTADALDVVHDAVVALAEAEGLSGHGAAMTIRRDGSRRD